MATNKPRIIVTSADTDDSFQWLSDGWNSIDEGTRGTPKAEALMAKAHKEIDAAKNVPDAIKRLRKAGFTVVRNIN